MEILPLRHLIYMWENRHSRRLCHKAWCGKRNMKYSWFQKSNLLLLFTFSTLDKQRICVNTQLKSSKKQLKWNVCVPKSNSNDRYAITCDVIAYHLIHYVTIRLINKCQSGIDFIFTSERAIYSTFMKISVPSQVFRGKTKWKWWKWNFAK